ncbi:MAG: type II toxin-antitoxin system toxin DNA ADP-ribosyl transferase DarT [Waterburya sp.]
MSTLIYHITHLDNLSSILNSGGLIACNQLKQQQTNYTDIAHQTIQDRRAVTIVPCSVGGLLHDYVPFYFAPRSPMLCAIYYQKGKIYQNEVIHLVSEAETIKVFNLDFAFTDGHAIMAFSGFYNNLNDLSQIDWQIMREKYWNDTNEDNDRKRRRQAEFLVHQCCPWTLIKEIGVINNDIKIKVEKILQNQKYQPSVKIYPQWYY